MRSWAWPSFLLPSSVMTITAQNIDLGWYPPSNTPVNDLADALTSQGVYGFIFNSSETPNGRYGTYNWCNMPHVRTSEYVRPATEYELKYVEVIQRHHKRTPYASNAFPVESYHWNCDDEGLYYYGRPFGSGNDSDKKEPTKAFWEGYISPTNPYVPSGWIGTCQFPQITSAGLDDSWVHGHDLYEVYHELLGFLPGRNENWREKVTYRVTQNVITSQVAGMLISGMWGKAESVPLMIQAAGVDSLEPQYTCNAGNDLFNSIKSSSNTAWQDHLDAAAGLFSTLDNISGVSSTDSGFHASFDHYFDNLSARQCHAKPLPCKLEDGVNSTTCVSQPTVDAVYRMGQWEYSQIYRDAPTSLAASSTTYGVWIAELSEHLRNVIARKDGPIYFHNIAHDGSLSRLLGILQIDIMVVSELLLPIPDPSRRAYPLRYPPSLELRRSVFSIHGGGTADPKLTQWPGMGSEVIFEIYKRNKNATTYHAGASNTRTKEANDAEFFVRVLFGGKPLKSSNPSLGLLDMVPAETLLAYFEGLVGVNANLVVGKCNGTIPI